MLFQDYELYRIDILVLLGILFMYFCLSVKDCNIEISVVLFFLPQF